MIRTELHYIEVRSELRESLRIAARLSLFWPNFVSSSLF